MPGFNRWKHHRRSVRLQSHDYIDGSYFVTICAHQRECLFGTIDVHSNVVLNRLGAIVQEEWLRTAQVREYVTLDVFVVMPNHFHAVLFIDGISKDQKSPVGATRRVAPTTMSRPKGPEQGSLGAIIGQFKSLVTKQYNQTENVEGAKVWQRSYYETVLRNTTMLNARRNYVLNNPMQWANDVNNPKNF